MPRKDNETYRSYLSTAFPLEKFAIDDATEMDFKTVVKRGEYELRYMESLQRREDGRYYVILDFDGFAHNVKPDDCLGVTDDLHEMIIQEYRSTIKEPIVEYMRGKDLDS